MANVAIMAAIDKSSTIQDVRDVYYDNLSYRTERDPVKCRAFIEACTAILSWPSNSTKDAASTQFDLQRIERQLDDANQWLDANDPDPNSPTQTAYTVRHDTWGFRD